MRREDFKISIIAHGSFVDSVEGVDYLIRTWTIRLNHVALNAWILSECLNTRGCYEDGEKGDLEWENHKNERAERRKAWTKQVVDILGIGVDKESACITQSLSEIFTVVCISEISLRD